MYEYRCESSLSKNEPAMERRKVGRCGPRKGSGVDAVRLDRSTIALLTTPAELDETRDEHREKLFRGVGKVPRYDADRVFFLGRRRFSMPECGGVAILARCLRGVRMAYEYSKVAS